MEAWRDHTLAVECRRKTSQTYSTGIFPPLNTDCYCQTIDTCWSIVVFVNRLFIKMRRVLMNPSSKYHGVKSTRDSEQEQCLWRRSTATWWLWWKMFSPLIQTGAQTWQWTQHISWLHKRDHPDQRLLIKHSSLHVSSRAGYIDITISLLWYKPICS